MSEPQEARYSIRVTSRLTSIELDTLRVWERRYGFPRPERTAGGGRLYVREDIEALKLIRQALQQGYRPSEVVGKPSSELVRLLTETSGTPVAVARVAPTVGTLINAIRRDDLAALRAELRQAAVLLGPKRFVVEVAHPACVQVGELWAKGQLEVRHEHLLTECVSRQLRVLMSAYEDREGAPRVLLATLPGERHGLGLELVEVYLAASQVTPVLLGVDTPREQIVKAAAAHRADAIGLLVTHASDLAATAREVRSMRAELPRHVSIWLGGAAGSLVDAIDAAICVVPGWGDLDFAISALGRSVS